MDFWAIALIALGGGLLGALLAELTISRALRSWQASRDIAAYEKKHQGKFIPNDWVDADWPQATDKRAPFDVLKARGPFDPNETLLGCNCAFTGPGTCPQHAPVLPKRAQICRCTVNTDSRKLQNINPDCPVHNMTSRTEREGEEGLR